MLPREIMEEAGITNFELGINSIYDVAVMRIPYSAKIMSLNTGIMMLTFCLLLIIMITKFLMNLWKSSGLLLPKL